ncbi:ras GEF [Xylariaceae sp. FL0804]|nr:ras GEF [Xylariaceae sp. FL0804]
MTLEHESMRSSLQVAPLAIQKSRSGATSKSSEDEVTEPSTQSCAGSQITPPATPDDSEEESSSPSTASHPVFYNFLRAFYPFQPTYAVADSTVTLPLNEGDVVLVHSIHTNGWADGTLLVSGARGWLPTNYCEAYDPDDMTNLLKALLNFWDLLRSTSTNDREIFGNQEFMKGIIAGVRYLLERTHCLTRESPTIQRSDILRRGRKSLLSELSSLVKTAKRLQEMLRGPVPSAEEINDIVDEMILKAFKIVVKGVRFLDLLDEDRRSRAPAVTVMATVVEESFVPPTPPAESTSFENEREVDQDAGSRATVDTDLVASRPVAQPAEAAHKRLSSVYPPANTAGPRMSQSNPRHSQRLSATISHRVSLAGPSPLSQSQKLVSAQLNSCHDTFLSHLSSFIGRLRLQSLSRADLTLAVNQSATSGSALLAVVNVVYNHDPLVSETLQIARTAMLGHIRGLVSSARELFDNADAGADADAEHVIVPQDDALQYAAIECVKSAGECVARTKWVLEKIGDFEFELESEQTGFNIDPDTIGALDQGRPRTPAMPDVADEKAEPSPTPRPLHMSIDKPLPEVPAFEPTRERRISGQQSPPSSRPQSLLVDDTASSMASSVSSIRPLPPPLPKLTTAIVPEECYSPTTDTSHEGELHSSFRSDTGTASSFGTTYTYLSRDSELSIVSQTSTRATTPDTTQAPKNQPSLSDLSTTGSAALSEEVDEVESRLLEKTFAHELMFNKEGQVVGGSLPALIERLTSHEATPDAVFVSAFYLTFRLFCTPTEFVEALTERFDYVGESPNIAGPVRLRVYNIMKGWLESHWRNPADEEALPLIQDFAEYKLGSAIPSAGRRLMELVQRVSSTDGLLVPRLVSAIGKTNTSAAAFASADTPLPNPVLSKSQQNLLNNWKAGGSSPSILDFDPVEIARQLTLKQMNVFCAIMPEELLGSQWMKNGGADSPHVKAMSGFSNDLSNLVADSILQYPEAKKRAGTIKQWIKIAHQCLELNNYDGLMAIVCSLNSSIINRLRRTWDFVSPKRREMFKTLQAIVGPSNNNKVLRTRLQGHVPPCLPFLGMFLTDLTFVDIGNPATKQLPGSGCDDQSLTVVNFDKHSRTAKIIGELQRFQIPYRLTEVPDLQGWIQAQVVRVKELDQNNVQVSYYRKSLLLEPREPVMRTPVDGPAATQSGSMFGWMSRDRHNHNNNNAVAT